MDLNLGSNIADYSLQCGIICFTMFGNIIFHCALCEHKYFEFQKYACHVAESHIPLLKIEDLNIEENASAEYAISGADESELKEKFSNELEEQESAEIEYGYVCLAAEGDILLHCALCQKFFDEYQEYIFHIRTEHTHPEDEDEFITDDDIKAQCTQDTDFQVTDICSQANVPGVLAEQVLTVVDYDESQKIINGKAENVINTDEPKNASASESNILPASNGKGWREFKCQECPFICKEEKNLSAHIKRHSNERPHQCLECLKAFYTRSELKAHCRRHTGERPYLCTECGKRFVTAGKLGEHNKRHQNKRDKACTLCGMKFFNMQTLKRHLTTHTSEGKFICQICSSRFKRRTTLKNHEKIHNNKLEYKCKLCPEEFNQSAGLWTHMKKKHNIIND